MSSGEFVGITADNPDQPIELKAFLSQIINDAQALSKEKASFEELPENQDANNYQEIQQVFFEIKQNVQDLADVVIERMLNDPHKYY